MYIQAFRPSGVVSFVSTTPRGTPNEAAILHRFGENLTEGGRSQLAVQCVCVCVCCQRFRFDRLQQCRVVLQTSEL